jgi:hypothetical protein
VFAIAFVFSNLLGRSRNLLIVPLALVTGFTCS